MATGAFTTLCHGLSLIRYIPGATSNTRNNQLPHQYGHTITVAESEAPLVLSSALTMECRVGRSGKLVCCPHSILTLLLGRLVCMAHSGHNGIPITEARDRFD